MVALLALPVLLLNSGEIVQTLMPDWPVYFWPEVFFTIWKKREQLMSLHVF